MKVRLPTGGALFVASDPTRDAPGECSQAFHLLPLIAAYLASTQCLLKMLELVRPLATVVKALNRTPAAMPFLRAAEQLAPSELAMSSAGMLTFVGDVLCVLTQALNCVVEQAKPVVELLTNLDSQIKSAEALGNAELVAALETEKNNLKNGLQVYSNPWNRSASFWG
jgi:hypothetical protein